MRACGFDPLQHRSPTKWSLDAARHWVHERLAAGLPTTAAYLPPGLSHMITRRVKGGWAAFVASMGLRYEGRTIRRGYWTKDAVVAAIRRRAQAGRPLNVSAVHSSRESDAMMHQARRLFGSWDAALRAAGIDPSAIRKRRSLRADDVAAAIRAWHTAGRSLAQGIASRTDYALVRAAVRIHGGWDRALRAAGVAPGVAGTAPAR